MITRRELLFSVITCYTVFSTSSAFLALHPVLPTVLRQIYENQSDPTPNATVADESDDADVRRSLGLIYGCGAVMQIVGGLICGWLPFGLTYGYILSSILCILYPIILLTHTSLVTLCLTNGLVSLSLASTCTLIFAICAQTIRNETFRIRIILGVSLSFSAASSISYASSGTILQFCGYNTLFGGVLTSSLLDLVARLVLHKILPSVAAKNESVHEPEVELRKKPSNRKWLSRLLILKDPYLLLLGYFRFQNGFSRASLFTTAPEWILHHIRAEQWQTGVIMGLSSASEFVALLLTALLVTSHRCRFLLIIAMIPAEGAGFVSYPFVEEPWTLLVPEMIIRSGQAISQALLSTLIAYIIERRSLVYQSIGYSLYTVSFSLGFSLGSFLSPKLVGLMTFPWYFVLLGSATLASGPLVLVFRTIRPTLINIDDVHDHQDEADEKSKERYALKLQTDDL